MNLKPPSRAAVAALLLGTTTLLPAATFTVTNNGDAGAGTLRQAIINANANADLDTIVFALTGGTGVKTITLASPLPKVTTSVIIDGTTQSGYTGVTPLIEINGTNVADYGLELRASNCVIKALTINNFDDGGILITNGGNSRIESCFIGLDSSGTLPRGNGASDNTREGIHIVNSSGNIIGGTNQNAGNVISDNIVGIRLEGFNGVGICRSNQVLGNIIGLDFLGFGQFLGGSNILGNFFGIEVDDSSYNIIGGSGAARNIISGNAGSGVYFGGAGAFGNLVKGNYIGLDSSGEGFVRNTYNGIASGGYAIFFFDGTQYFAGMARSNIIGELGVENYISSNGSDGIAIYYSSANRIAGNVIGLTASGTLLAPNLGNGVAIYNSTNNFIGDPFYGGNHIAGNSSNGVFIGHGDYTYRGADTNAPSVNNFVRENFIARNGQDGVHIRDGSCGTQISGNFIGNVPGIPGGRDIRGNLRHGVSIFDCTNSIIANTRTEGGFPISGNRISGNVSNGVFISNSQSNIIQANDIGLPVTGNSGAVFPGGNGGCGIFLTRSSDNVIGGIDAGQGNHIAFNGTNLFKHGHGVVVESGNHNPILGNSFWDNSGRGIDLGNDSFDINDIGDRLIRTANAGRNYPVVIRVSFQPQNGTHNITWILNSLPDRFYRIEFFGNSAPDPSGFGEGQNFLGYTNVLTDAKGNVEFTKSFADAEAFISTTATDFLELNTSEFSPVDTDGDAIADAWETLGIDFDEDGTIDLQLNSDPRHKDIFVEIDAMEGRAPDYPNLFRVNAGSGFQDFVTNNSGEAVGLVIKSGAPSDGFYNAPNSLVQNPDRENGVWVHLELDDTDLPLIPWDGLDANRAFQSFDTLKRNFFGTAQQRTNANALAAKSLVYRYCMIADYSPIFGGLTRALGANDFFIVHGPSSSSPTDDDLPAGVMHELGHSLGLDHGGIDDINFKPNYHSVMNYGWERSSSRNHPWLLDYSGEQFATLNEGDLNETVGIGASSAHAGHMVMAGPWFVGSTPIPPNLVPEVGPVDWNGNSNIDLHVERDIDYLSGTTSSPGEALRPSEDWSRLRYYFLDNPYTTVIGLQLKSSSFSRLASASNGDSGLMTSDIEPTVLDEFEKLGTGVGFIQFTAPFYTVSETGGIATITVRRLHDTAGDVCVTFSTVDGSATAGSDYIGTNGILNFVGDETVKSFAVPILNDSIAEGPETVRLVLSNPTGGATLGYRTEAVLTIIDDDPPGRYSVTNTSNSGAGSLRQAILDANATPGLGIISFNIPGTKPFGIFPIGALPGISNSVTIDGTTQPGFAGTPIIQLNGGSAGAGSDGLRIFAKGCVIRGLIINGFSGNGINLASDQNKIEGCYIGLTSDGNFRLPNSGDGINISSSGNVIGGLTLGARNYISGNNNYGIEISGTNNFVLGNVIGLTVNGFDQGNTLSGISISSSFNTIGGAAAGAGNVISGNDQDGISLRAPGIQNQVIGNFIGTDPTGTAARGNSRDGILVNSTGHTIGGSTPKAGNVISGNGVQGIELAAANGVVVLGNRIGTDVSGQNPLPNQGGGIAAVNLVSQRNQIGWPAGIIISAGQPFPANTIAFNNGPGIWFAGPSSSNNTFRGNSISSNAGLGIQLDSANQQQEFPVLTSASNSASGTIINGTLNSRPNATFTIDFYASQAPDPSRFGEGEWWFGATTVTTDGSGNASFSAPSPAIYLKGPYLTATATDAAGNSSDFSRYIVANNDIPARTFTVINTNDSGAGSLRQAILDANAYFSVRDTIAFNIPGTGVRTIRPLSPLPTITDPLLIDGYTQPGSSPNTAATGHNGVLLIQLDGSATNFSQALRIEAGDSIVRGLVINRFGANAPDFSAAIMITGRGGNHIEGNFIGTDPTGFLDRGNLGSAVVIFRSSDNIIGGTSAAARNVISANHQAGGTSGEAVLLYGDGVLVFSGNRIEGNLLGTAADGRTALGNSGCAVRFGQPVWNTTIGGTAPGAGNVIAFNAAADAPRDACGVDDPLKFGNPTGIAILGNSIHSNFGLGIGGNLLNSPDGRGNFPFLSSAISSNGLTTIRGRLQGVSNVTHRIEFFANDVMDPSGFGEGKVFLGATNATTDSNGFTVFTGVVGITLSTTQFVTATATDDRNNTSEFSPRLRVGDVLTNVIVVNSINDVDDGIANTNHTSLREAIFAANNHPGPDLIRFAIGSGGKTIGLTNSLPALMDAGTTIDATTQPGFAGQPLIFLDGLFVVPVGFRLYAPSNTIRGFAIDDFGYGIYGDGTFASPFGGFNIIEGNYLGTDGVGAAARQDFGISLSGCPSNRIGGATTAVRNIISGNKRAGVVVSSSDGNTIAGNFIGTDRTGTNALGNGIGISPIGGMLLQRCRGTVVGGSAPGAGNLISGNASLAGAQLFLWDDCSGSIVQGNLIGTDVTGRTNFINATIGAIDVTPIGFVLIKSNLICGSGLFGSGVRAGVYLNSPSNRFEGNLLGTDATGTRTLLNTSLAIDSFGVGNVIGGTNAASRNLISGGINIMGQSNVVQGNLIGTLINGTNSAGNGFDGVLVQNSFNQIGGVGAGAGNTIAFNAGSGVLVSAGTNNAILGNSIFSNTGLAIDLGVSGVTTNDLGDLDSGPNNLQNFPILSSARNIGSGTLIAAALNSRASTSYRIEFFANTNCHSSGFGQGRTFLNSTTASTDPSGNATASFTHPVPIPAGQFITATATDPNNNTSEFSPCVAVINDTNYVVLSFVMSNSYTLSWPVSQSGFVLERATNLAPPVIWQVISNGIATNAGSKVFVITNDPALPTRFFRLRRP